MSTIHLIILLCFVVSASSRAVEDKDVEDRIHADSWEIDGMKAKYGDRPYQVFVTTYWCDGRYCYTGGLCGGVLIEMNYVLTAAHCVNSDSNRIPSKQVLVKAGIIKKSNDPYEQKQLVTMDSRHVKFNPNWDGNINKRFGKIGDLAILKLNEKFESKGGRAAPIKIYNKKISTIVGKDVTLSGWGMIESGPNRSNPKYTNDLLVSTVKHGQTARNGEMLQLSDEDGNVSCGGDSGGPATYNARSTAYKDMLVGITHAGISYCGHNEKQSFYTSVEFYLKWICDNIDEKVNMAEVCGGGGGGSTPEPSCEDSWSWFSGYCSNVKRGDKCDTSRGSRCKKTCGKC